MTPLEHIPTPKILQGSLCLLPETQLHLVVSWRPHPQEHTTREASVAQHHREWFLPTRERTRQQRKASDDSCCHHSLSDSGPRRVKKDNCATCMRSCAPQMQRVPCGGDVAWTCHRSHRKHLSFLWTHHVVLSPKALRGKRGECQGLLAKRVLVSASADGVQNRW